MMKKKGVAGLNVFLSLVVMLFMIGLIVMVFTISGSKLRTVDAVIDQDQVENGTTTALAVYTYSSTHVIEDTLTCYNYTGGTRGAEAGTPAGNYTVDYTAKTVTILPVADWNVTDVQVEYDEYSTASDVINATYTNISSSTGWFSTFIVLGAMVVLILLTVIIINSIRGSGITASGGKISEGA